MSKANTIFHLPVPRALIERDPVHGAIMVSNAIRHFLASRIAPKRIMLTVDGYCGDKREVHQIPEVRTFAWHLFVDAWRELASVMPFCWPVGASANDVCGHFSSYVVWWGYLGLMGEGFEHLEALPLVPDWAVSIARSAAGGLWCVDMPGTFTPTSTTSFVEWLFIAAARLGRAAHVEIQQVRSAWSATESSRGRLYLEACVAPDALLNAPEFPRDML